MIGYIYEIFNEDRSLIYIGSTTQTVKQRWNTHTSDYKRWLAGKQGACSIYQHFKEHGIDKFNIKLISEHEIGTKEQLREMEQLAIDATSNTCNRYRAHGYDAKTHQQRYYEKNKDTICEKAKQYYEAHKEDMNEKSKKYYEANKDLLKNQMKHYREANKERLNKSSRDYYVANKEKITEKNKQYHEANKTKFDAIRSQKFDCPCGGKYGYTHKASHLKTKKHTNWLSSQ